MVSVKSLWPRLCAGLAFTLIAAHATADMKPLTYSATGSDLHSAMELSIKTSDQINGNDRLYWMYVRGFMNSAMQGAEFTKSALEAKECSYPYNADVFQVSRVVKKYLEDNPDKWDLVPPFGLFYLATEQMIICKKG